MGLEDGTIRAVTDLHFVKKKEIERKKEKEKKERKQPKLNIYKVQ